MTALLIALLTSWLMLPEPEPGPVAVPESVAEPEPEPEPSDAFDDARALRRAGKPREAAQALEADRAAHATDGDYLGLLGLCLLDAGEVGPANQLLAASEGASESFRLHTLRGRLAQFRGETEGALVAFRAAVKLNETALEARVGLVQTALKADRFGLALSNAERIEGFNPAVGRELAAQVLRAQGDQLRATNAQVIEAAADKYAEALAKTPDDEELATLLLETRLVAVQVAEVQALVEARYRADDGVDYHYWTGRRLATEQDAEGARAAFTRALEREAEHTASALWLGRLALDAGDAETALSWLERCHAWGLRTGQTELLTGEALTNLGRLAEAETHLAAAVELEPKSGKAVYLFARVLARLGKTDESREMMLRFQEIEKLPPVETPRRRN